MVVGSTFLHLAPVGHILHLQSLDWVDLVILSLFMLLVLHPFPVLVGVVLLLCLEW